jgi:hypothetical protein
MHLFSKNQMKGEKIFGCPISHSENKVRFPFTQRGKRMNSLAKLKMISAKRGAGETPVTKRRQKLSVKLDEQIQLAKAQAEGRVFAPTRLRSVVDAETGEKRRVESVKRVQPWWWSDGGKVHISVRYGAKPIEFAKGKNAIEVGSAADVVSTLELVKQAVAAGELDAQIDAASAKLREGFGK